MTRKFSTKASFFFFLINLFLLKLRNFFSQRLPDPVDKLGQEVCRHNDGQDGLALLLLLVLQLDGHQTVVELGDLAPDQLELVPGAQVIAGSAETSSHALASRHQGLAALRLDAPAPLSEGLRCGCPVVVLRGSEWTALQLVGLLVRVDGRKSVIVKSDRSGWSVYSNLEL